MVKVECQLCGGLGHKASVCPSRTSTGRRLRSSEKVCQLCDQVGHDATACPAEGGGDEEDDDHADDPEDDDDEDDEAGAFEPVASGCGTVGDVPGAM